MATPAPTPVASPTTAAAAASSSAGSKSVELYVATPCYGCKLTIAFAASLLRLQTECASRNVALSCQLLGNESLVPRARNILIEQFIQSGAKNLLFLDADLAFSPAAVLDRLLPFARKRRDAIVTGVYPKKAYDWSKLDPTSEDAATRKDVATASKDANEPVHMRVLDYNINIYPGTTPVKDGFVRVLDSATGCMLIPREVILSLREAYGDTLGCVNDINPGRHPVKEYVAIADCMIEPETRRYLSEDYALCRRVQAIGGEIYADIASGMCHIGTHTYEGDIRKRPLDAAPPEPKDAAALSLDPVPGVVDLVIVTENAPDMHLSCVMSVLKMRQVGALRGGPRVDISVVDTLDDALNVRGAGDVLVIVHGTMGFPPEFVLDALVDAPDVVAGVYPHARMNWARVTKRSVDEPTAMAALEYNVRLAVPPKEQRYVPVHTRDVEFRALRVRRRAIEAAEARHPEIAHAKGHLFAVPEIVDGEQRTPSERVARLLGGTVYADCKAQCTQAGPAEFAGCVGMRHLVR